MAQTWQQLVVSAPRIAEEAVSAALTANGADGVAVTEAGSDSVMVAGYFAANIPIIELRNTLSEIFSNLDFVAPESITINGALVTESDWVDNWKQYYHPIRVTRFLTILPSWNKEYQAAAGEMIIQLDPDIAFGTGSHPTTALALLALENVMRGGEQVIDVGTGSGILAIAAAALGAGGVLATDIDQAAVQIAQANVDRNPGRELITLNTSDLLTHVSQRADVIIANILAEVLLLLINDAGKLLLPGGHLILSGIYFDKLADIQNAVAAAQLDQVLTLSRGDWYCVIAQKPA